MNEEYFIDSEEEIREREALRAMRSASAEAVDENPFIEDEENPKEKRRAGWLRWIGHSLTGEILVTSEVQQFYNVATVLGVIFFFAIFAMFASFHREMQYRELQKEVVLLRESAIRSIEKRHLESSHSMILQRLHERGLNLEDPSRQPKILK